MSILGFLKKLGLIAGQTAPDLIAMVNPPLGALVGTILNSVMVAEAKNGPGNGESKRQEALSALQVSLPLIVKVMKSATNRDLADETLLSCGMEKLSDGIVDLLNAFRILPKTEVSTTVTKAA